MLLFPKVLAGLRLPVFTALAPLCYWLQYCDPGINLFGCLGGTNKGFGKAQIFKING